ncbi:MAG: hypothetical protein H6642_13285 [Caldilineaceae bacterium]|nr:hypothetical protein [Caldilineaceae bacterium]
MSQKESIDEETELTYGSPLSALLIMLLVAGLTIFLATTILLGLSWLTALLFPVPFWQMLITMAALLLIITFIVLGVQPASVLSSVWWILGILLLVLFAASVTAWLSTLFTPLTMTQTLTPAVLVALTAIYYFFRISDELMLTAEAEIAAEDEAELWRGIRSVPIPPAQEKKPRRKRRTKSNK